MRLMNLIAAAAAAMLPSMNLTAGMPPAPDLSRGPRMSRSRTPFSNTFERSGKYGQKVRINRDTKTRAGVPGSKLARKAAERRLGLYAGRR